ncbi:hypothetical protein N7492_010347 [Penicillium capsulatum]|uniref:Uncharacterized protein n=1 Tax=Penicillium capsulatum TaxID=69766 RepID=A0A9W9HP23_9EURO|nr:hypothetical protein N7492_010347 [Penicillium capsulatum]KAJ6112852.1 hypothetical protein N7512_008176 [Penicillium capsulatum]
MGLTMGRDPSGPRVVDPSRGMSSVDRNTEKTEIGTTFTDRWPNARHLEAWDRSYWSERILAFSSLLIFPVEAGASTARDAGRGLTHEHLKRDVDHGIILDVFLPSPESIRFGFGDEEPATFLVTRVDAGVPVLVSGSRWGPPSVTITWVLRTADGLIENDQPSMKTLATLRVRSWSELGKARGGSQREWLRARHSAGPVPLFAPSLLHLENCATSFLEDPVKLPVLRGRRTSPEEFQERLVNLSAYSHEGPVDRAGREDRAAHPGAGVKPIVTCVHGASRSTTFSAVDQGLGARRR